MRLYDYFMLYLSLVLARVDNKDYLLLVLVCSVCVVVSCHVIVT